MMMMMMIERSGMRRSRDRAWRVIDYYEAATPATALHQQATGKRQPATSTGGKCQHNDVLVKLGQPVRISAMKNGLELGACDYILLTAPMPRTKVRWNWKEVGIMLVSACSCCCWCCWFLPWLQVDVPHAFTVAVAVAGGVPHQSALLTA